MAWRWRISHTRDRDKSGRCLLNTSDAADELTRWTFVGGRLVKEEITYNYHLTDMYVVMYRLNLIMPTLGNFIQ